MWSDLVVRLVERCRRAAPWVAAATLLASAALGTYAATHLSIDADESKLLSRDLPWQQREARYEALFPDTVDTLVVVIDGSTSAQADAAAADLAARLAAQPARFRSVQRPDAGPFFRQNGLLFLDVPELAALSEHLIQAQPMIGGLTADPSLRGLFNALKLALAGVQHGDIDASSLSGPVSAIAAAIDGAVAGTPKPMAWDEIFTGRSPRPQELRRFIITQPVLDYTALEPGSAASAAIRTAARDLGLGPERGVRVRLTGPVALNDDELASVRQGAALSTGLSAVLVVLFLFFALRSLRLIAVVIATLAAGFALTAAFATFAVGTLNVISTAFAVMFLGTAVDFAIQFTVRTRAERHRTADPVKALHTATRRIATPLTLAATTTALGFLSFVPTDYRGISELGLIAAGGMVIALGLSFTLLPALLTLVRPSAETGSVGFSRAAPLDRFLLRRRSAVLAVSGCLAVAAAATLPWVQFDFNPLHLKDPHSESMATLLDLAGDPETTPFAANVVAPSPEAAADIASRLSALPAVGEVLSLDSLIPQNQDEKLSILADLNFFLGPALTPANAQTPPTAPELRAAATALLAELRRVESLSGPGSALATLRRAVAGALDRGSDDAFWSALHGALVPGFLAELSQLREALKASPVTRATLPPDLVRAWVAPSGENRVQAVMRGNILDNTALAAFRAQVQAAVPDATGPAITIQESADTITHALVIAGASAAVTITLVLLVALRRPREVFFVLAPLVLAALLTLATGVIAGLPLNFANVITLPLLLGIGVAFDIYFVVRWREGMTDFLSSATARAVLFSALTTIGAFGTLVLSSHRGTAEMGALLVIALGYALLATFVLLPALLGPPASPSR